MQIDKSDEKNLLTFYIALLWLVAKLNYETRIHLNTYILQQTNRSSWILLSDCEMDTK